MINKIQNSKFKTQNSFAKGFTIIELIIFSGLLSILLVILSNVFVSILNVRLESEATSSVIADGRYIISRLTYDIQRASAITTPASLGGTSSTLQLTIGGVTNTYTSSGGTLTVTAGSETNGLTSYGTTVSDLAFTRIGNSGGKNTIRVSFQLQSTTTSTAGRAESKDYQTTIGRR